MEIKNVSSQSTHAQRAVLALGSMLTGVLCLQNPAKSQPLPFSLQVRIDANELIEQTENSATNLARWFGDLVRKNWPDPFKNITTIIIDNPEDPNKFSFNLSNINPINQNAQISIDYSSDNWAFSGTLKVMNWDIRENPLEDKISLESTVLKHKKGNGANLLENIGYKASAKKPEKFKKEIAHGDNFIDRVEAGFTNIEIEHDTGPLGIIKIFDIQSFVFELDANHEGMELNPRINHLPPVSNIDIDPIFDFPLRANADFFIDLILDRSHESLVASSVSSLSYQLLYDSTELLFDRFEPYTSIITIPSTCIPNCRISQGFSAPVAGGDGPINLGRYYFNAKNPEDWPGDGLSDVSFSNFEFKDPSGFELTDYQVSPVEFEVQMEQVPGPAPFLGIFAAAFHARRLRSLRERMRLCTNRRL